MCSLSRRAVSLTTATAVVNFEPSSSAALTSPNSAASPCQAKNTGMYPQRIYEHVGVRLTVGLGLVLVVLQDCDAVSLAHTPNSSPLLPACLLTATACLH